MTTDTPDPLPLAGIEAAEAAVQRSPAHARAWEDLAFAYRGAGMQELAAEIHEFAEAIPAFEKAIGYCLEDARLWATLGFAYANVDQHSRAVQAYRLSLRFDARQPQVVFNLAVSCRKLGRLEEATAAYEEAARVGPTEAWPLLALGSLLLDQSRPADALPHLRRAACLTPQDPCVWRLLGDAHGQLGNARAALEAARQRARLDSESPGAHVDLGMRFRKAARPEEVARAAIRAVELEPEVPPLAQP